MILNKCTGDLIKDFRAKRNFNLPYLNTFSKILLLFFDYVLEEIYGKLNAHIIKHFSAKFGSPLLLSQHLGD